MNDRICSMPYLSLLVTIGISVAASGADWPQWGRTNSRNMVCDERNLPDTFVPGERSRDGRQIKQETTKNVKWAVRVGTNIYGNPVVADGRLYLGNKRRFHVFAAGKKPRLVSEIRLGPTAAYSSPIAANGVLYVTSQRYVWAVQEGIKGSQTKRAGN